MLTSRPSWDNRNRDHESNEKQKARNNHESADNQCRASLFLSLSSGGRSSITHPINQNLPASQSKSPWQSVPFSVTYRIDIRGRRLLEASRRNLRISFHSYQIQFISFHSDQIVTIQLSVRTFDPVIDSLPLSSLLALWLGFNRSRFLSAKARRSESRQVLSSTAFTTHLAGLPTATAMPDGLIHPNHKRLFWLSRKLWHLHWSPSFISKVLETANILTFDSWLCVLCNAIVWINWIDFAVPHIFISKLPFEARMNPHSLNW